VRSTACKRGATGAPTSVACPSARPSAVSASPQSAHALLAKACASSCPFSCERHGNGFRQPCCRKQRPCQLKVVNLSINLRHHVLHRRGHQYRLHVGQGVEAARQSSSSLFAAQNQDFFKEYLEDIASTRRRNCLRCWLHIKSEKCRILRTGSSCGFALSSDRLASSASARPFVQLEKALADVSSIFPRTISDVKICCLLPSLSIDCSWRRLSN